MRLADLPSDLLGLLLASKLTSFLIIPLWKSGDRILQHKLSVGVHFVDLDALGFVPCSRFPKLLSCLKNLRHLALSRGRLPLMPSEEDLSAELRKLDYHKLETLKISSLDASGALVLHDANERARLGLQSKLWTTASRFPVLSTLHIAAGKRGVSDIAASDFCGLPPTLTKLTTEILNLADLPQGSFICASLPRALLEWKTFIIDLAGLALDSEAFWKDAPPHLQVFGESRPLEDSVPSHPEVLPRSLVNFAIGKTNGFPSSFSYLQRMPPLFDSYWIPLGCHGFPDSLEHFQSLGLPRQPSTLKISPPPGRLELNPSDIGSLPRSLLDLTIADSTGSSGARIETNEEILCRPGLWPPALTSLDLGFSSEQTQLLSHLPATLTELTLHLAEERVPSKLIPRCISTLWIHLTTPRLTLILEPGLPETLLHLHVKVRHELTSFDIGFFDNLPSSLLSLSLPFVEELYYNDFYPFKLPSGLTSLMASRWPIEWFESFPSSLTALKIPALDLGLANSLDEFDYCFGFLSSNLVSLTLSSWSPLPLSAVATHFSRMTRLVSLNIQHLAQCDQQVLQHLPGSLRKLHITLETITREFAKLLNPRLTVLHIATGTDIGDLLAEFWPLGAPWIHEGFSDARNRVTQRKEEVMQQMLSFSGASCPSPLVQ